MCFLYANKHYSSDFQLTIALMDNLCHSKGKGSYNLFTMVLPKHIFRFVPHVAGFMAVLCVVAAITYLMSAQNNAQALSSVITPLSPATNSYALDKVTLSSKVNGSDPDEYEMFWATENGEWNRMATDSSTGISKATISIDKWNWKPNNQYIVRFIALFKDGWRPVEQSIVINKGIAPATSLQIAKTPALTIGELTTAQETPSLYIDTQSVPAKKVQENKTDTSLKYIAAQPLAKWIGDWNTTPEKEVNEYVSRAAAASSVPTLVLYNIMNRDCGSYSSGGAKNASEYNTWIKQVARGIGERKTIVILEPDAVADLGCLSESQKTERLQTLSQAVETLKDTSDALVYIDAGHPDWHSATSIAKRLTTAGVKKADGFSLNVSNFKTTKQNTEYGKAIASKIGNKHFVIDTSRNGASSKEVENEWCNPSGAALGKTPTLATGDSQIDAYLWIKTPGESDGSCGDGAPNAGEWWQDYADSLYKNSL